MVVELVYGDKTTQTHTFILYAHMEMCFNCAVFSLVCFVDMALRGKVVWITGASSGIGEELAYQLAAVGARLALSARREAELEKVKQNCLGTHYKRDLRVYSYQPDVAFFLHSHFK